MKVFGIFSRESLFVYVLHKLFNQNRIPAIPIFVDSPLAVNSTEVYRMHPECFNDNFASVLGKDPDPFGFDNLFYITRQEDSKKLNDHKKPCIIISASGMMEAGRVKHHLANNISDPRNTILVVGYCAPTTLGARIVRGDSEVSIHGNPYEVKAEVKKIESYSGHGDYREMISFLDCQDKGELQKTFIVHGEYETQKKYSEYLANEGYNDIEVPARGEEYEL